MNVNGKFRAWGTSTGMVYCKLEYPSGSTTWELTPEDADTFAADLIAQAAWVRKHVAP
jgi:hypothetical protein